MNEDQSGFVDVMGDDIISEQRSKFTDSPHEKRDYATLFFLSPSEGLKATSYHRLQGLAQARDHLAPRRDDAAVGVRSDIPLIMGALPFDASLEPELYASNGVSKTTLEALLAEYDGGACRQKPVLEAYRTDLSELAYGLRVEEIKKRIAHSNLDKLVLGRCATLRFSEAISVSSVVERLLDQNPQDTVFRIPLKLGGTLVGASPERLIRKYGDRFSCNPLAGSIPRSPDPDEDERRGRSLLRSAKDREEHAIVVAELKSNLKDISLDLDVPKTPSLARTATMWHLSTTIHGRVKNPRLSALDLARLIHPTAAMCGAPKDVAFKTITELEPTGRGLFTGMVGWCDARGDGEWAVTIRSAIIHGAEARVFSGAGIVKDSDPATEWHEIEAKLGTMLRAFGLDDIHALQGST